MKHGVYKLKHREKRLEDLEGARIDLDIAQTAIQFCVDADTVDGDQPESFEEAYWTTALIRYSRAFSQKIWLVNGFVLPELTKTQRESHHYFIHIRNKMIAHGVGLGSDIEVRASVYPLPTPGSPVGIVGVGAAPRRISSPGTDAAKEFLALLIKVSRIVNNVCEKERRKVESKLQQMPLSDVVSTPLTAGPLPWGKSEKTFLKHLKEAEKIFANYKQ
jgi:hypothetical protein